jgi:tRNA threonylcarbamoyladenosine biosynthesis protein TsaB
MSLILNIDTALDTAMISLSKEGKILDTKINSDQKDHAAWLHPAIVDLLQQTGYRIPELHAVSVSIGPGSYTGLRVGLSAAKGICYARQLPLIAVPTLDLWAFSTRDEAEDLICPLIDARRMEVFAAVYDKKLIQKIPPLAVNLHINSFESLITTHKMLFCGNGITKARKVITDKNARFSDKKVSADALASLAYEQLGKKQFADLAYTEPLYIKEFYTSAKRDRTY